MRRPIVAVAVAVVSIALVVGGVGLWRWARADGGPTGAIAANTTLSREGGFLVPATLEEDIANADAVVAGHVRSVSEARWSTADGKAPSTGDSDGFIYRTATFEVWEVLSGHVQGHTIAVTIIGGEVDGNRMDVADGPPELRAGETLVLFALAPTDRSHRLDSVQGNWDTLVKYVVGASGSLTMSELRARVVVSLRK